MSFADDLHSVVADIGAIVREARTRDLTPAERDHLRRLAALAHELQGALAFMAADDDGEAIRRLLGPAPVGRA